MRAWTDNLAIFMLFTLLSANSARAAEYEVGQNKKRFTINGKKIEMLYIKVGDTVRFKNEDPFYHGIYSVSEISTFELGAFRKGQARNVTFNTPGRADIECAVHADMHMVIEVGASSAAKSALKNLRVSK